MWQQLPLELGQRPVGDLPSHRWKGGAGWGHWPGQPVPHVAAHESELVRAVGHLTRAAHLPLRGLSCLELQGHNHVLHLRLMAAARLRSCQLSGVGRRGSTRAPAGLPLATALEGVLPGPRLGPSASLVRPWCCPGSQPGADRHVHHSLESQPRRPDTLLNVQNLQVRAGRLGGPGVFRSPPDLPSDSTTGGQASPLGFLKTNRPLLDRLWEQAGAQPWGLHGLLTSWTQAGRGGSRVPKSTAAAGDGCAGAVAGQPKQSRG